MALQFSTRVRNARLDTIEATIGAGPTLQMSNTDRWTDDENITPPAPPPPPPPPTK